MQFNNPIPRGRQPHRHEGSSLKSPSDRDNPGKAWSQSKQTDAQVFALAHNVSLLQRTVERLRRRIGGGGSDSGAVWLP